MYNDAKAYIASYSFQRNDEDKEHAHSRGIYIWSVTRISRMYQMLAAASLSEAQGKALGAPASPADAMGALRRIL
jgi:hypothetical protein